MLEEQPKNESVAKFTPEEIETAQQGLEKMAARLNELLRKQKGEGLTEKERKEVDLICHNAQALVEIASGETPWEFEAIEKEKG